MSEPTRDDLKTILLFALHIAKADDDLAGSEKTILGRYVKLIGLSAEERAELAAENRSLHSGLDHLTCDAARELLVKTICAIAHADGVRHDAEDSFIRRVYAQLGRPLALKDWEEWGEYEGEVLSMLNELSN